MRVHFTVPRGAFQRDYEKPYPEQVMAEVRRCGGESGLVAEDDPAKADLIVFLESAEYKTLDYIRVLENDPVIRAHAERVYSINYDDHPEGFLAGLYTSIEPPIFNGAMHGIWPVLFMNNALIYEVKDTSASASKARVLYSFTGAESHPLRGRLFSLFSAPSPERHIERILKWYNHNDDDRRRFIDIALNSTFCLCPRGYTSYTHRIQEIMALGRVPVIIADDWLPFTFDDPSPYYVKVAEKDLEKLPEILRSHLADADTYAQNARRLWEKYCGLNRRIAAAVECIARLAAASRVKRDFKFYREFWHSKEFLSPVGWTLQQRVALRLQQHLRKFIPSVTLPGITPEIWQRNAPNRK